MTRKGRSPSYRRGLSAGVLEYFSKYPGQQVFISELEESFSDWGRDAIRGAVTYLASKGQPIETVMVGNCWTYKPNENGKTSSNNGRRIFEELATTKSGKILIQDEQGSVYEAVEL